MEVCHTDPHTHTASLPAALARSERVRLRATLDAIVAALFGLNTDDLRHILRDCDLPTDAIRAAALDPKGFWRIDKTRPPELRQTVLTLIAFWDLESRIHAANGDRHQGIQDFLTQNDGQGWLLPETLRLADYGLGHDDRARRHQPVAARLGPRFYDWQLARGADEALCECHLHARNLLGHVEYAELLDRLTEDGVATGDQHREYFYDPARDLMYEDPDSPSPATDKVATSEGGARRAAEPKASYSATPSAKRPQKEMFRGSQTDLFE